MGQYLPTGKLDPEKLLLWLADLKNMQTEVLFHEHSTIYSNNILTLGTVNTVNYM